MRIVPRHARRALPAMFLLVAIWLTALWTLAGAPRAAVSAESAQENFLPDTAWLLRVGPRTTRVADFVDSYFASLVQFRPSPDSAGRVEFLKSIRDKDVIGLTALALDPPLGFEQRAIMREHTQRVLSNALYQRMVLDSVKITDEDTRELWRQEGYKQHFRQILFDDRPTAERVRRDLVLGRVTWRNAVRQYDRTKGRKDPDGDIGWLSRTDLQPDLAFQVFGLKPGETSEVVEDRQGFHLVQSLEQKPQTAPLYGTVARSLRWQLADYRKSILANRFQAQLANEAHFVPDSANLAYASSRFKSSIQFNQQALAPTFEIQGSVPEFAPEDTGRVLATWDGGVMTIHRMLVRYSQLSPLVRPSLNSPEAMTSYVRSAALEPSLADFARKMGLERAPDVMAAIEKRKEQLLVEQMYRDSVSAFVRVSREDERKYYEDHEHEYVTFPKARIRRDPARDGTGCRLPQTGARGGSLGRGGAAAGFAPYGEGVRQHPGTSPGRCRALPQGDLRRAAARPGDGCRPGS